MTFLLLGLAPLLIAAEPDTFLTQSVAEYAANRAAQIHLRFEVDPEMKDQILCIRPRAATSEQLDSLVASALGATLLKEKTGWRFRRTRADKTVLADRHRELGKHWLEARFAEFEKEIVDGKPFGSPSAQFLHYVHLDAEAIRANQKSHANDHRRPYWPIDFSPAGRLAYRLVRLIDIDKLAEISSERPVVFSNVPTGNESGIPNALGALSEFVDSQRKFDIDPSDPNVAADLRDSFNEDQIGSNQVPNPTQLKVILTARRNVADIGFALRVYGPDGSMVAKTFFESKTGAGNYITLEKEAAAASFGTADSFVTLSEDSERYLSLTSRLPQFSHPNLPPTFSAGTPSNDLIGLLPKCITHPDVADPNRFALPEMVQAMAGTLPDRPVVALLTDSLWQIAPSCLVGKKASGARFKAMLPSAGSLLVDTKEGYILRPIDPLEAVSVDRKRLGEATRLILSDRRVTVRNWSLLASSLTGGDSDPVIDQLSMALHYVGYPESGFQMIAYTRPAVLKLLAKVPQETFGQAVQLSLDPTEPGAQAILWRALVGTNSPLVKAQSGKDISTNPTVAFPSGPLRPQVTFACRPQSLFTLLQNGNPSGGNPFGAPPEGFAPVIFASANTRESFDQTVKWLTSRDEFTVRVDSVANYDIQLAMPGGAKFDQPLREVIGSNVCRLRELPAEFWNQVYDGRQKAKAAQVGSQVQVKISPP